MSDEIYEVLLGQLTETHVPALRTALDGWESGVYSHNELLKRVKLFAVLMEQLIQVDSDHGTDPWR